MKLNALVANILSVPENQLDDQSSPETLSTWDSAKHIDLLLAIEVAYNIQFTMSEISSVRNLGDLHRMLAVKGAKHAA